MQWRIEGSSAASGKSVKLSVDAADEVSARAMASELGIVATACVAIGAPLVNYATPPARNANLVAAVVLASALVFASLLVTVGLYRFRAAATGASVAVAVATKPAARAFAGFPRTPAVAVNMNVEQLVAAANRGDIESIKSLLQAEPDVNASDLSGATPLTATAGSRMVTAGREIARMLIARGAKVNVPDREGRLPLHMAASNRDGGEIARLLLDAGADPNAPDPHGDTPAHLAAEFGFTNPLAELLAHGAKVDVTDAGGQTPLHRAAGAGKKETVVALLQAGANVNAKDAKGYTPLKRANLSFRDDVAAALKSAGGTE
jgi:hypothetical protein